MSFLIRLLVLAIVVYGVAMILPGIKLKGFGAALSVSVIYSLLNFILYKVFFFIGIPLMILSIFTLGLVGWIVNAILLVITDKILDGFELAGFGTALLAAFVISLVNMFMFWL